MLAGSAQKIFRRALDLGGKPNPVQAVHHFDRQDLVECAKGEGGLRANAAILFAA